MLYLIRKEERDCKEKQIKFVKTNKQKGQINLTLLNLLMLRGWLVFFLEVDWNR